MAEFKRVARTVEIPAGQVKGFEIGADKIVVCNTGQGFYAVINECSHESLPLSEGKLKGNILICPHHGARYDVATGEVTRAPAIVPIDTSEIKVENGELVVKID